MNRRDLLEVFGAAGLSLLVHPARAQKRTTGYDNLLVLVELKGGNDGLNTVIPFADPQYAALRPRIAISRDRVLMLDEKTGLHPAMAPLMPLWKAGELAVLQGVGYPDPNLSHFRSIEIWDTASDSSQTLDEGWLMRAFAQAPPPRSFAADGIVVGSADAGPLEGTGARVITLANTAQFLRQARFANAEGRSTNAALDHILKVEQDIVQAAQGFGSPARLATPFPAGAFGGVVRAASEAIASRGGVAAVRLSLGGFDTHSNQVATQERLLGELASGLVAFRAAMQELHRWESTLVVTYAEFGRRPRENQSGGTDHGTANAHFVLGGSIAGGLHGAVPRLDRLDATGNPGFAIDFRSVYATVLERWWGLPSQGILNGRFPLIGGLIGG